MADFYSVYIFLSLQRITKFLLLDEIDASMRIEDLNSRSNENKFSSSHYLPLASKPTLENVATKEKELEDITLPSDDSYESNKSPQIFISSANFSWDKDDSSPFLSDINLSIESGSFIAIVGVVGSGKSSLLSAILGNLHLTSGVRQFDPPYTAYVAQDHWIQNIKMVDNILFGDEYNDEAYQTVLDASQLSKDLLNLPNADYTEIGERGINLSGGQKVNDKLYLYFIYQMINMRSFELLFF